MMESKARRFLCVVAFMATAQAALSSCDDGGSDHQGGGGTGGDDSFVCDASHDQWEQCTDNMVQWCHAELQDPHFHWGANCEDIGLECVELSESEAACVDTGSTCTPADANCQDNTAYNCLPDGHWAVEPCTSSCVEQAGEAQCEQQCTTTAPDDACAALATAAEQKQVVENFDDVFSEDYHAELNVAVEVTLPDNAASQIHFPVAASGEFVVFLDTVEVFDTFLDQSANDMLAAGGGANSACPNDLPDHYYADLIYSGSGDPVPYVLRFKAVPTQTVTFIVVQKCQ